MGIAGKGMAIMGVAGLGIAIMGIAIVGIAVVGIAIVGSAVVGTATLGISPRTSITAPARVWIGNRMVEPKGEPEGSKRGSTTTGLGRSTGLAALAGAQPPLSNTKGCCQGATATCDCEHVVSRMSSCVHQFGELGRCSMETTTGPTLIGG